MSLAAAHPFDDPRAVGAELERYGADAYGTVYDHLVVADALRASDAVMCFGSRDEDVPARAAQLFHDGVAPLVVTTGGIALHRGRSEADVFSDELVRRGVPADRIIVERESTHTGDNVVLGVAALQQRIGPVASIVAVAWPFAARRCVLTFGRHHPTIDVRSAPAVCQPDQRTPLTPTSARWAVEQLERLVVYAEQGVIAAHTPPADVIGAGESLRDLLAALAAGSRPAPR